MAKSSDKIMLDIPVTKSAIEYYEALAARGEYDKLAKEYGWLSPEVVFGLVFEFIRSGQKLLDVGCGTGLASEPFAQMGVEIYGIDGSKNMVEQFRKKGFAKELQIVDLIKSGYPYRDSFFNHVTANGVFYFFKNLEPLIRESARVLKDRGILSFTIEELRGNERNEYINFDNAFISKNVFEKTGVKVYRHNLDQVKELLTQNHFEVLKMLNFHAYKSPSTGKDVYFTAIVAIKIGKVT